MCPLSLSAVPVRCPCPLSLFLPLPPVPCPLCDLLVILVLQTDDFFPYADGKHAYWTGYFTSRPALKFYVRKGSAALQSSRQLDAFTSQNFSSLEHFAEVMGVVQHHDSGAC